jgi:hypothetical protein
MSTIATWMPDLPGGLDKIGFVEGSFLVLSALYGFMVVLTAAISWIPFIKRE